MDKFEQWEKMLNSTGTTPKIWRVFEQMKQEIKDQQEEIQRLETELMMLR